MKTNNQPEKILRRIFFCSLFGHRFFTTKKVNSHFNEYECSICHLQVTNDSKGKKIILTAKLKEINEAIQFIHQKKRLQH
jgi:hypothetical protein